MKKLQFLLGCCITIFSILIICTIAGCKCIDQEYTVGKFLAGEHNIRKLTVEKDRVSKVSGTADYFIFMADASLNYESRSVKSVFFFWQTNDGSYVSTEVPIHKIKIKINNESTNVTVKFEYVNSRFFENDANFQPNYNVLICSDSVYYAVITCKSSDWPSSIKLSY